MTKATVRNILFAIISVTVICAHAAPASAAFDAFMFFDDGGR